jgi:hypothetical protein
MHLRLKTEDVNTAKCGVCQQRGDYPKTFTFDDDVFDKAGHYLNILTRDERVNLLAGVGSPLASTLATAVAAISGNPLPGPVFSQTSSTREAKEKTGNEQIPYHIKPSPSKYTFSESLALISESTKIQKLAPSQHLAKALIKLTQEPIHYSSLATIEKCEVVNKYYQDRFFVGSKVVVQLAALPDLARALLQAISLRTDSSNVLKTSTQSKLLPSTSSILTSAKNNPQEPLLQPAEGTVAEGTNNKEQLLLECVSLIETTLLVFVLLLENRVLELVTMSEVANSKIFFASLSPLYSPKELFDPDLLTITVPACNMQQQKNNSKVKLSQETHRYFKIRRSAKKIPLQEFVERADDFLLSQAFAKLRGYNSQLSSTVYVDQQAIVESNKRAVNDFKKGMTLQKKKSSQNSHGHGHNNHSNANRHPHHHVTHHFNSYHPHQHPHAFMPHPSYAMTGHFPGAAMAHRGMVHQHRDQHQYSKR